MQKALSNQQVKAFYHDEFVEDQTRNFVALVGAVEPGSKSRVVADVGGGCGFFAKRLEQAGGHHVRVIDTDAGSVDACRHSGIEATRGDALDPPLVGDEDVVSFNLVLHHLVGTSETVTRSLQHKAISVWRPHVRSVFVNEYIYESYVGNLSGWLIYQITKSRVLSLIGHVVAMIVPSLKANTFGVGVRFRAHDEWVRLFVSAGYDVSSTLLGEEEHVAMPLRLLLLIKRIRRDSFLLLPRSEGT